MGGLNSGPGTRLANIGNMPDLQISPTPNSAPKKIMGWVIFVLVLASSATGVFLWWDSQHTASPVQGEAESTLVLETFVVNLTGSGQRAYLRVGITLGVAHPLPHNPTDVPIAPMRDTILSVLATAQPEDLLKLEGKRYLKEELLKALQERVPQMAVQNIYFTEFLVQM